MIPPKNDEGEVVENDLFSQMYLNFTCGKKVGSCVVDIFWIINKLCQVKSQQGWKFIEFIIGIHLILELFQDDSMLSIFFGESSAFWYCQGQPQSLDIVTK